MRTTAIAAGALLALAAASASAQVYYERTYNYDPYYGNDKDFDRVIDMCEEALPKLLI